MDILPFELKRKLDEENPPMLVDVWNIADYQYWYIPNLIPDSTGEVFYEG